MRVLWLQEAIDRVRSLEASGELTGVMDDRGKVQICAAACILFSGDDQHTLHALCFPSSWARQCSALK